MDKLVTRDDLTYIVKTLPVKNNDVCGACIFYINEECAFTYQVCDLEVYAESAQVYVKSISNILKKL